MGIQTTTAPFSLTDGSVTPEKLSDAIPVFRDGKKIFSYNFDADAVDTTRITTTTNAAGTATATVTDIGGYLRIAHANGAGSYGRFCFDALIKTASFTTVYITYEFRLNYAISNLSTFALWFSATGGYANNSAGYVYNVQTVNKWSIYTNNAGSVTKTDDVTGISDTNWHELKIKITGNTRADFYLDGTLIGSSTTNLPVTSVGNSLAGESAYSAAGGVGSFDIRNASIIGVD